MLRFRFLYVFPGGVNKLFTQTEVNKKYLLPMLVGQVLLPLVFKFIPQWLLLAFKHEVFGFDIPVNYSALMNLF